MASKALCAPKTPDSCLLYTSIFAGVGLSMLIAAPIGAAASQVGTLIMWATEQAPFLMGILVSVIVGVALTPVSYTHLPQ